MFILLVRITSKSPTLGILVAVYVYYYKFPLDRTIKSWIINKSKTIDTLHIALHVIYIYWVALHLKYVFIFDWVYILACNCSNSAEIITLLNTISKYY